MGGGGEVESHPPGFERQQHDGGTAWGHALEVLDHLGALLLTHGAVQSHKPEAVLPNPHNATS